MDDLLLHIKRCKSCSLFKETTNIDNMEKGYGKLVPFWRYSYHDKVMLVGLNPSYRRYPGIFQAFGGMVAHSGTGYDFIKLLEELKLLDDIYLTNLVKCSTVNNKVSEDTIRKCYPIFMEEVEAIKPPRIIALGRAVHNYLQLQPIRSIVKYVPHPTYWSAYKKMTKQEYSKILWNAVKL